MDSNVSSFEVLREKVHQLIVRSKDLEQKLEQAQDKVVSNKIKMKTLVEANQQLSIENEQLKMASGLLGTHEHRKLMKLKINRYIKEIDTCIAELTNR